MLRFGLCCAFRDQPIKFKNTTATAVARMPRRQALEKLNRLCLENADALIRALRYCHSNGIGCFRINSQILPLKTHPQLGYEISDLADGEEIVGRFEECGGFVRTLGLRVCFHPDQFVVLNSPRPEVVAASLRELDYQAEVAEWVAADVINIHGGGAYGDKAKSLSDLERTIDRLPLRVRTRLTLENDDRTFTPTDLIPVCGSLGIPLVYDVHHHRCLRDQRSVAEITREALETWDREPMFHLSSPREGWEGPHPERHHDFIDVRDFPDEWHGHSVTIEVEAKAKESAVFKLMHELDQGTARRSSEVEGNQLASKGARRV